MILFSFGIVLCVEQQTRGGYLKFVFEHKIYISPSTCANIWATNSWKIQLNVGKFVYPWKLKEFNKIENRISLGKYSKQFILDKLLLFFKARKFHVDEKSFFYYIKFNLNSIRLFHRYG